MRWRARAAIKADSAHKLLGGATGAALLTIGRRWERIDPEGLRAMLGDQRGEFVRRLPGPVASLFGNGKTAAVEHPKIPAPVGTPAQSGAWLGRSARAGSLRWSMLGALMLIAIPLLRAMRRPVIHTVAMHNLPAEAVARATIPMALPNGQTLTVARGIGGLPAGDLHGRHGARARALHALPDELRVRFDSADARVDPDAG